SCAVGVAACGPSDTADDGAGSGGNAGSGTGSGGSAGGATGGQNNVDPDPILCGGAYPAECAEGKLCRFSSGCGTVGHCGRRPEVCDDGYEPVCGCDGETYGNSCSAES